LIADCCARSLAATTASLVKTFEARFSVTAAGADGAQQRGAEARQTKQTCSPVSDKLSHSSRPGPLPLTSHFDATYDERKGVHEVTIGRNAILLLLALTAMWFVWQWFSYSQRTSSEQLRMPRALDTVIGFVANFFDTLGIGSFATTTATFKMSHRVSDHSIPGTLNVGHALPTLTEALIFVAAVSVDLTTLLGMIVAAVAGAWLGAGLVSKLPRRAIQVGLGLALVVAGCLILANNLDWIPGRGEAHGLTGGRLAFAICANFALGALNMLGVGLYAPCLILVSLLGMSPLAAFPIMMGSCAFLMPIGGVRFIRIGRYDPRAALGLTLGGIPGVLVAAFIVKSLPISVLRWLVVIVVLYAATLMIFFSKPGAESHQNP
jgi:uncharacterized membrane protein YfcA